MTNSENHLSVAETDKNKQLLEEIENLKKKLLATEGARHVTKAEKEKNHDSDREIMLGMAKSFTS